jgi:hypothetical protein
MRILSSCPHLLLTTYKDHGEVGLHAHPRTSHLEDAEMPLVSTLLGAVIPPPLQTAVATSEGRVTDAEITQVTWWPGKSIAVRYKTMVTGGALAGRQAFVCVAGRIPNGALLVESVEGAVGVWRVPHDPALPGLPSALNHGKATRLLTDLGAQAGPVTTSLVSYRPGRRAVVAVNGGKEGVYLKLVRTNRVEHLHRSHRSLASALPVPESLGYAPDLGLIALQSLPGMTLRAALEDAAQPLPTAEEIVGVVHSLPQPESMRMTTSPIERMPEIAAVLAAVVPELSDVIARLVEHIGEEQSTATTPTHGDFYESQLLVGRGAVVGLLDLDTYGWGRPGDDAATMLGHLSIWAGLSKNPARVLDLGRRLLAIWDRILDPVELRVRTAAVALSLATGPFRVQAASWPGETADRVHIAERWLESANRAHEKSLIPVSPRAQSPARY